MPVEISVGPPVITINQGSTFMLTDLNGEIAAETELGLFCDDTRFLSYYAISANGEPWVRLSSSAVTYYASQVYLTNNAFATQDGDVPGSSLSLSIARQVGDGIWEKLEVCNYGDSTVKFNLEVALRCDFADIFEVRARNFIRRGRIDTIWDAPANEMRMTYSNQDFQRSFIYRIVECKSQAHLANGRITFEIELMPGQKWSCLARHVLGLGEAVPQDDGKRPEQESEFDKLQKIWREHATKLTSVNEEIYRLFSQSVEDLGALRLRAHENTADVWVPAAGVPWYVTLFGRDSLITSLQSMIVNPSLSCGALNELAQYQATKIDDWRDAEPGKILHEIRFGELAHFKRIPHTPYYGTADATPLYLVVLHQSYKWLGDEKMLHDYRDVALRCLEWIDKYGDLDGDGFQEYRSRSAQGYENMIWKDSPKSVVYPDGAAVPQPKAVCELQGYVFAAWMCMSELFELMGEKKTSAELKEKARILQGRFEESFWCPELGFYALALDPDKQPVKTIASNVGHCLWSGIISKERATAVVERFFEPDMWSGWGIRTLSSKNPAFNPFSYHNGSVWPHDNGIIALGFKRYGFADEAARVARDISQAASFFVSHRLPELYCGIERRPGTFPVQYLGANVPQAWAAASTFHLVQALLGLQADAGNHRLYVDPKLPKWLPELTLNGLLVGDSRINIRFWRQDEITHWDAQVKEKSIEILPKPFEPWPVQF